MYNCLKLAKLFLLTKIINLNYSFTIYKGKMSKTKHPTGLRTLFFTEMWERMSLRNERDSVLFMTASIANGGLDFSNASASAIYGIYAAAVYLMALLGWIADTLLVSKKQFFLVEL